MEEKDSNIGFTDVPIESNEDNLELYSSDFPFRLPLRIRNFQNEPDFVKFARNCEKLIRGCLEYKLWKNYIRDVLQVNSCAVTKERMDMMTVEIHHHIPTLFVIVKAIINKNVQEEKEFSSFDVCLETIEQHFKNRIGYVALITSIHEKVHNGYLSIPIELVRGNYKAFLTEYGRYMDTEDLEKINENLSVKLENIPPDQRTTWEANRYPGLQPLNQPETGTV
jgi:hypothetical protein